MIPIVWHTGSRTNLSLGLTNVNVFLPHVSTLQYIVKPIDVVFSENSNVKSHEVNKWLLRDVAAINQSIDQSQSINTESDYTDTWPALYK